MIPSVHVDRTDCTYGNNGMEWFKRQFSFDLPVEMLPNVIERLRRTPARLQELTQGLPREVLTRRDGDKWSIQEQAGHLLDLEELWLKRLDDFKENRERLAVADLSNRKTHEANHNANTMDNILAAFRRERMILVQRLDADNGANLGRTALHPRLNKPMRVIDHLFFVAEHDDHHLARIVELKRLFEPSI